MQKFEFEVPVLEESKFGTFFAGASFPDQMTGEGTDGLWDPSRTVKTAGIVSGGFFMPFFKVLRRKTAAAVVFAAFIKYITGDGVISHILQ